MSFFSLNLCSKVTSSDTFEDQYSKFQCLVSNEKDEIHKIENITKWNISKLLLHFYVLKCQSIEQSL